MTDMTVMTAPKGTIRTSAPGSTMITGEHAVVYGAPAIVCAIEQRIFVKATPIAGEIIEVHSEIAGPLRCSFTDLPKTGPYRFVSHAIAKYAPRLRHGVRLEITSQIDPTLGLGSSAAVTIATLGALSKLAGDEFDTAVQKRLHSEALVIVRTLQGRGSGADLAASVFGGMIAYQLPETMLADTAHPDAYAHISALPKPPPMGLCYCGYKTPTGEVLAKIAAARLGNEARFDDLYVQMSQNAQRCTQFAKSEDWPRMATLLNEYQNLMEALGVSDAKLDQLIVAAKDHQGLLAAKISGSGLGDCVLSFGSIPETFTAVKLAETGLQFHD